ncbi:hypothetical protein H4R19_005505 [Coemansia spiralis]|nr:hypothetical protein H4R19_005505 [Coemansia spiralis]
MSFKRMIRRTCARVARNITRGPVRLSAPAPVPAPAPLQAFTPFPAPLPAAAEWAASVSSKLAEIIDAADVPAHADSVPANSSDATPAPAVEPVSAPAPAPAPAVVDGQNTDEAAAAQRVPDEAPTTGNLRQRAQQYNVARQPAAECSKSEGLMLRCIKLEDEAAPSASGHSSNRSSTCTIVGDYNEIARMREELATATAAMTLANQRAAQAERALANSEAVAAAAAATADAAAVDAASALEEAIDRAERAERDKLYLARLVALASINADSAADDLKQANARADRAERDLARFKARAAADAASADRALKHANERTQEYAKVRSATSASNRKLQQLLGKKGRELVAALTELDTTRQMLSDTRNELAAERNAASERSNANTRRGVDAGQQADDLAEEHYPIESNDRQITELNDMIFELSAENSRLVLNLGEMAGKLDDEQDIKKYIIHTVRDWVKETECRCSNQIINGRWDLLSWLDHMDS